MSLQRLLQYTRSIAIPLEQGLRQNILQDDSFLIGHSIAIPLEQGLRLSSFILVQIVGLDSIAIPLEQGLRQNILQDDSFLIGHSIAIPLEQGLRPTKPTAAKIPFTFYRYSIRTRIKTTPILTTLPSLNNSIAIPLEQGLRLMVFFIY